MADPYRRITLWNRTWRLDGVIVARSRRSRRLGLNLPKCHAVLVRTSSIQTFTMSSPITVCEIDDGGRVLMKRVVQPRRVVVFRSRCWVLETDSAVLPPPAGIDLCVLPSPRDDGNTHALRDADREPPRSV